MHRFRTTLVAGRKRPYTSWTFLVVPSALALEWSPGPKAVRGTISGCGFRGTAARGEGVLRVPIARELRERAKLTRGAVVDVSLELDTDPREIPVPDELRAVFEDDPEVGALYRTLPPSCRRAWATYVARARQPDTRRRRAAKAPKGIRAREFPR
ncbi:MAG: DUF1905 domain-containing protein [Acidobacteriota bacterium]|nr:DUF1905 domain-containing protein [Acidobacteriota bacterium]